MVQLTSDEIIELEIILNNIRNELKISKLNEKLGLTEKIAGFLGEGLALVELYNYVGTNAEYNWYGGRKKDYDIEIKKNGVSKTFQIKSSKENYAFSIGFKKLRNSSSLKQGLRNGENKPFFREIKRINDEKKVDYYIFSRVKLNDCVFYVLTSDELFDVIEFASKKYISTRKNKSTNNFGIKKGGIRMILKPNDVGEKLESLKKLEKIQFK